MSQLKTIRANHRTVKMGRKRPPVRYGTIPHFSKYLMGSLPIPPATCDYSTSAMIALSQMYLNSDLGDCVIAGMAHQEGVWTGNAGGNPYVYNNDQIIALYSAIGGYVPGNASTDQGCDEVTALNYWINSGAPLGSNKIAGFIKVSATSPAQYKLALWLFEGLFFGLELPDSYVNNPTPGFVWGPGTPNPENGHCIIAAGFTPTGLTVSTWGMLGTFTDAGVQAVVAPPQYGGELYALLSMDAINKAQAKAPNALDWPTLIADFNAMGGNVPAPTPTPPTPVPPTPPIPTPPVPPTPPPAPVPTCITQQETDAAFAALELKNPRWAFVLRPINAALDKMLFGTQPMLIDRDCMERLPHIGLYAPHLLGGLNWSQVEGWASQAGMTIEAFIEWLASPAGQKFLETIISLLPSKS